MVIAVTVTFLSVGNFSSGFIYVLIFLAIGGSIGAFIAYRNTYDSNARISGWLS